MPVVVDNGVEFGVSEPWLRLLTVLLKMRRHN